MEGGVYYYVLYHYVLYHYVLYNSVLYYYVLSVCSVCVVCMFVGMCVRVFFSNLSESRVVC